VPVQRGARERQRDREWYSNVESRAIKDERSVSLIHLFSSLYAPFEDVTTSTSEVTVSTTHFFSFFLRCDPHPNVSAKFCGFCISPRIGFLFCMSF
jgi:hypothetical protein